MRAKIFAVVVAVPATALGLFAQENVTFIRAQKTADEGIVLAQGAVGMIAGPPMNVRYMSQDFVFNSRSVTGQPYSAEEKTESVQTLADGTRITNTTTSKVWRDSQGRTRREVTMPAMGGETPHVIVSISDPVGEVSYSLDPQEKMAHEMPQMMSTAMMSLAQEKMKAEAAAQAETKAGTMIGGPNVTIRTEAHSGPAVGMVRRDNFMASKREDLGADVLEGVNVKGTRETSTIEAGAMGNDRPITIKSERWVAADLGIEMKSVHSDPRMGETTHVVTNVTRTEPDPSLFQVPADYKLENMKMRAVTRGGMDVRP